MSKPHAANAYPRLVEALRPMIEGTAFITDAQVETARALLRELDAAYIAHAANAYPRLVEALRNLGAGMPSTVKSVNDATELLRELGEL